MTRIMPALSESTPSVGVHISMNQPKKTLLSFCIGALMASSPLFLAARLPAQDAPPHAAFPDTDALIARVATHQKDVEELILQYTCTYKTTVSTLDKTGTVRNQHTDTYYMTPTRYEVFTLHINHDGKPVSQQSLEHQQKQIEHKLQNYERRAQKNPDVKPKDTLLFGDIILKSKFKPLKWEDVDGTPTVVYAFEPKAQPLRHGAVDDKIASDMKGKMWINPEAKEVVRMEFTSVSPLGLNSVVRVKNFQGVIDQRKVNGEVWMPSRQDFVAQGREIIKGFRIRQVSEFSDYLKATTDVFQQIHAPSTVSADGPKAQE
jgi:outer membrane lipoprotein-sorting protein